MSWTKQLPASEITEKVTRQTVMFAEEFGHYLGVNDTDAETRRIILAPKMTTTQLRRFFGEVKRQQMEGYNETDFILLKPKLAYAVGRADKNSKIKDFYSILSQMMDLVDSEEKFKRFIQVFEAIVAYHKAAEEQGM